MSVFTTVISFPFWLFGAFFLILGIFGRVTDSKTGLAVRGEFAFVVRVVVTVLGFISMAIAYGLTLV